MAAIHSFAESISEILSLLPRALWKATGRFARRERTTVAAAMAYYGLFSLFPMGLITLAALAYIRPDMATHGPVIALAETYLPGAEQLVRANLRRLVHARSSIGFFGLLSLLWSASSVFAGMGRALEKTLGRSDRRSPLRSRLVGLVMVFVTASLGISLLLLTSLLPVLTREGATFPWARTGITPLPGLSTIHLATGALTVGMVFFTTLLVYRFFPSSSPPWRDLWPGAFLATVGLVVARNLFSAYVAGIQQYELIYGTLGAVIVVLLWFFVSAVIFLWGAEVSGVLNELRLNGRTHGPRS